MTNIEWPEDVQKEWAEWFNVLRRLQSEACNQTGCAEITIKVLVTSDGVPVFWESPVVTRFEPSRKASNLLSELVRQYQFPKSE